MNARVTVSLTPDQIQDIIIKHFEANGKQIASGVKFKSKIQYEDRGNGQDTVFEKAEIDLIIEI